jgi:hypothetical protein
VRTLIQLEKGHTMSTIIAILIVGVLVLIAFRLAIHFSQPKRPGKPPKTLRPSLPRRRVDVQSVDDGE